MIEKSNQQFKNKHLNNTIKIPSNLELIINAGFNKCGDVVYAQKIANPSIDSIHDLLKSADDLTGIECAINKIHIEDYLENKDVYNHELTISCAIVFIKKIAIAIHEQFPNEMFRIILSEEEGEYPSVVFRFHKKRIGESWLADDLESYKNGVYFLDIG